MEKLESSKKNILAVDIGLKRIGLAFFFKTIIFPLDPILRKNRNQAVEDLRKIINEKQASLLVVGFPQSEEMQKRIIHFVRLLDSHLPLVYIDEDFTSQESKDELLYLKKKERQKAKKDGRIDSLSACKILERYLDKENLK